MSIPNFRPRRNLTLISENIQDGGGGHIENHIFGHNSAIFARICTEFETGWKWGPADRLTVKIHIVHKSKMAEAAILKSVIQW